MSDPLQGKNVLVIGFARQGRSLAKWLPTVGAKVIVNDSRSADVLNIPENEYPDVTFVLGGHKEEILDGVDLVCLSGGVSPDLSLVKAAAHRDIPLSNDAQLFLERCSAPVIGITGSAGKTTTTTLVGEIFKKAQYRTWVGGNIGEVLLDILPLVEPSDRVVMELSSFQLELMTVSPEVGSILNITPNHLDRHQTMDAYTEAKLNIINYQDEDGTSVLGWDNLVTQGLEFQAPGKVAWFSTREMVTDGAFLAGNRLTLTGIASPNRKPQVFAERADIQLRGEHNVANVLAACAITGVSDIKPDAMVSTIREFRGVPHRLELVREFNQVLYVNDSIATSPERVFAALRSYNEPVILLLGGRDKKLPWEEMIAYALRKSRHIFAFGEVGSLIESTVKAVSGDAHQLTRVDSLDEAVQRAVRVAQSGDVVLLSPGGTSYDAYPDFAVRGEHFRTLVNAL